MSIQPDYERVLYVQVLVFEQSYEENLQKWLFPKDPMCCQIVGTAKPRIVGTTLISPMKPHPVTKRVPEGTINVTVRATDDDHDCCKEGDQVVMYINTKKIDNSVSEQLLQKLIQVVQQPSPGILSSFVAWLTGN